MVIIAIMNFPPECSSEMYERYSESFLSPEFISIQGPYVKAGARGMESITIFEFEDNRYVEARDYVYRRMSTYLDITGLTYSADVWIDIEEANKYIPWHQRG